MREHDEEPVLGLPERLPAGEKLLWQGRPEFWSFARHALHSYKVICWFALVALWRLVSAYQQTQSIDVHLIGVMSLAFALAMGVLLLLAYLLTRVTLYSLTNKRIIMRFGIAVQLTINIPFSQILNASTCRYKNGNGNIALEITGDSRLSYFVLWPHVRPFHWFRCQPTLRNIPDVAEVAGKISAAVASRSQDTSRTASAEPQQESSGSALPAH